MPVLGGSPDGGRREATAYARNQRQFPFMGMILLLVATLVLRNILFHDYRSEAISQLKDSGKTLDEIERYIPGTASRSRQDIRSDQEQVQKNIEFLLGEVKELRLKLDKVEQSLSNHDGGYQGKKDAAVGRNEKQPNGGNDPTRDDSDGKAQAEHPGVEGGKAAPERQ